MISYAVFVVNLRSFSRLFFLLLFFCTPSFLQAAIYTGSDGVQIRLTILGCNNNFTCESSIGEDYNSCSSDCAAPDPDPEPEEDPAPTGGIVFPSGAPVNIESIIVVADTKESSAALSWKTTEVGLSTLSWGKTFFYENGEISEYAGSREHGTTLSNLLPGTKYYFKIVTRTAYFGDTTYFGSFTTLPVVEVVYPEDVSRISVNYEDKKVKIEWRNPSDPEFSNVYIVRSPLFYPSSPEEGRFVYEGSGSSVFDPNVEDGKEYFYSVFAKTKKGEYSSGVGASLTTGSQSGTGALPNSVDTTVSAGGFLAAPNEFSFVQSGIVLPQKPPFLVELDSAKGTNVIWNPKIKKASAKKIILSLSGGKSGVAYIFKENKNNKIFHSSIGPLGVGEYSFTIAIYDSKNNLLSKTEGILHAKNTSNVVPEQTLGFFQKILAFLLYLLDLILTFIRSVGWYFF